MHINSPLPPGQSRRRQHPPSPPPPPLLLLAALLAALLAPERARGANWAQISGEARQNVAVPAPSPWTRRWGHAFAAVETLITDRLVNVLFQNERSRLYVLGGDSWKRDTSKGDFNAGFNAEHFFSDGRPRDPNYNQQEPGWADTGSGALLNDVWWSTGASWEVFVDERNLGPAGDPLPRLVSQTAWTQLPPWPGIPPQYADWREYLGCCHANPNACTGAGNLDQLGASLCPTAFPCPITDAYGENLCLKATTPDGRSSSTGGADLLAQSRRWSPRRGHRAVTVYPASIDPAQCPRGFLGTTLPCGVDSAGQTVWPALATLVVLGGRARSLERMSTAELNGGFLGDPADPATATRNRAILMNDVWVVQDGADGSVGGAYWDFTNQGCWVAQADQVKPPGVLAGVCATDADCWRANFGDAACQNGACVCRHWSPRERFGAVVRGTNIYVAGGLGFSEQQLCGHASCGTEYATFLNDVWVSTTLGQTWTEATRMAAWAPRADLAFVFGAKRFWVIGGQGGDVQDFAVDPLFSDSWYSTDLGKTWVLNASYGGWAARGGHSLLLWEPARPTDGRPPGTRFMLLFGQKEVVLDTLAVAAADFTDAELVANAAALAPNNVQQAVQEIYVAPPPGELVNSMQVQPTATGFSLFPDAASALGADIFGRAPPNAWWADFDQSTPAGDYAGIDAPAPDGFRIFNYSQEQLWALANASVTTIYELSTIPKATVLALQATFDQAAGGNICFERRRAEFVVSRCQVAAVGYDGDWFKSIQVDEGIPVAVVAPVEDLGCDGVPEGSFSLASDSPTWVAPTGTRYNEADYVCRQYPRDRRSFGGALMSEGQSEMARAYVAGGWEGRDIFANDVWYRDEQLPVAYFTHTPADMSYDTVFEWQCLDDKTNLAPVCIFECRVTDVNSGAVLRDWGLAAAPFDVAALVTPTQRQLLPTRFDLRAIDPAGNRDLAFVPGGNTYTWHYKPPFPIVAVTVSLSLFFAAVFGTLYAIRQYEKRVALEIYMARRMARKLKAEGAGIRKKVVVLKKKKKVQVKRTSVQALREASERDKFKALLGGRAERSSRQAIEVDPTKKLSAKERFAATSAVNRHGAERDSVDRDAKRFAEETARAKAMLRGRAVPSGGSGGPQKLGSAAPSLRESAVVAAAATPAYAQTLKAFKEAKRREEEERAAEKRGEARINFSARASPAAIGRGGAGGGGGGGSGGGGVAVGIGDS